jgi:hypothetical protein
VRLLKERKKIVSNLGIAKPENRLLRLLRSELVLQVPLANVLGDAKGDSYGKSRREIDVALAEAEYQKGKATVATQQARSFC